LLDKKTLRDMMESLVAFRSVALSNDIENELPSPYFHNDLSDMLLKGKENIAVEMFRESGKSSYALRTFPLHSLTYPSKDRDYIVLIKQNQRQASNKLKEIIAEYQANPLIKHNLVEIKEQSEKAFSVDVKDPEGNVVNVRIEAFGKGSGIRGLSNQDRRPKIIILDDIQDKEDARSETIVENDWNWFLSDILFLGKKSRLFLIGNNLGERCVIERVINSADQLKFKAIRIPVMIDGKATWAEKQSLEEIEQEKKDFAELGKLDIWYAEKMCQAVAQETQIFNHKDFRYFFPDLVDKMIDNCNVYACLDPASSTRKDACYRAIAVVAVNEQNNWFILDMPYGRWDSAELLDQIFRCVKRYGLDNFYIEKGHFQQILEPFMMKEMSKRNVFFNVEPLEHGKVGNKLERIKMLQPRFKAHTIYFPNEADWLGELKAELAGVTKDEIKSEFIDLVDALAMTEQVAEVPHNHSETYEEMVYNGGNVSTYPKQNLFDIAGY
jgi:predicted phage terminase large subunit-like protein